MTWAKMARAAIAGVGALRDPTRGDLVAVLGEATGINALTSIRSRMLLNPTGRRILRERPLISSASLRMDALLASDPSTFGHAYASFMRHHDITADSRSPITLIDDPELAYVMLRYRQVHDFWHTLLDLPISVEAEIALKYFEYIQTSLPVAFLSSVVGPLRLTPAERDRLFTHYAPWAIQVASNAPFLMNVMYEELLDEPIDRVRKSLGIFPLPETIELNVE